MPYGKRKYAYNVYFTLNSGSDERIELLLNSYFMQTNSEWMLKRPVYDAETLKQKCKGMFTVAAISGVRLFYYVLEKCYRKNGKNILFMSETKEYLWGNLKYIEERMKQRGLDRRIIINKNHITFCNVIQCLKPA